MNMPEKMKHKVHKIILWYKEVGKQFPPAEEVARYVGISSGEVRKCYNLLAKDKLIEKRGVHCYFAGE